MDSSNNGDIVQEANDLLAAVQKQRDNAFNLLARADAHIIKLMRELEDLKAASKANGDGEETEEVDAESGQS